MSHLLPKPYPAPYVDAATARRIAELEAALRDIANVKAAVEIMDDADSASAEYSAALNRARAIARRALGKT